MVNPLAAHPPWRQLLVISLVVPTLIVLEVLAFAWPSARTAPRDLPVGIVGTSAAGHQVADALTTAEPGGFDAHRYVDQPAAETAIRHREIYGAFVIAPTGVTVLEASAASTTVAQLLTVTGEKLTGSNSVQTIDVVPVSPHDVRGAVLSSAVLPLTICGILVAAAAALLVGFRPAWRQLVAVTVVSTVAGTGAYLIAQGFLGALPGDHLTTWATLALTILAISAPAAGLISLLGAGGLGLSTAIMVFVGNPFSGVSSAPQLLPAGVDHLGQWLPPGAGANLLRSTAYFHDWGAAGHLGVLITWTLLGFAAVIVGHHTSVRFAAHPAHQPRQSVLDTTSFAHAT